MQKRNEEDYLQRIQYYASHAITDQLEQEARVIPN